MRNLLLHQAGLAFVAALVSLASAAPEISPFVVGGREAKEKQFPEIVSLQKGDFAFCGGFIIDKQWIVTASHCVEGERAGDFDVVAGITDVEAKGIRKHVKKIIMHEDFGPVDGYSLNHDIALLQLDGKLPLSEKVQLAPLPKKEVDDGQKVVVAGWGRVSNDDLYKTARHLKFADLKITPKDVCAEEYSDTSILDNQICASYPEGEDLRAECNGDSGGPLYSHGYVVGIVSFSKKPCGFYPGVFASVHAHRDWIKKHTGLSNL